MVTRHAICTSNNGSQTFGLLRKDGQAVIDWLWLQCIWHIDGRLVNWLQKLRGRNKMISPLLISRLYGVYDHFPVEHSLYSRCWLIKDLGLQLHHFRWNSLSPTLIHPSPSDIQTMEQDPPRSNRRRRAKQACDRCRRQKLKVTSFWLFHLPPFI